MNFISIKKTINSKRKTEFSNRSKLIVEGNLYLHNTIKELARIADRVDVLDTTEEEFKYLAEFKRIKRELEKVLEQYN